MSDDEKAADRSEWRASVVRLAVFGTLLFAAASRFAIASDGVLLAQLVGDDDEPAGVDDEDQRLQAEPLEEQPLEAQPWHGRRIDEMGSANAAGAGSEDEVDPGGAGKADETGDAGASERPARQPDAESPPPVCKPATAPCTVGGSPPCCSGMCLNSRCA